MARELSTSSLASDANLVSYYKLENTSDSKGSNTLTNNNSVAFNAAQFNNGADFGSANTNKTLSTTSKLSIAGSAMSISCWVNVTTAPGVGVTVGLTGQEDFNVNFVGNRIFYVNTGGTLQVGFRRTKFGVANDGPIVNYTLTPGQWYHLVYTYDGSNINGYINGVLIGGPTASTGNGSGASGSTKGFTIGNTPDNYGFFSGLIDDAAIFSRALSATEVANIFSGVFSPSASISPSISPSASISPSSSTSPSLSPSASISPSSSISASISPSSSASPSSSTSASLSPSASPSPTPSPSASASPSPGFSDYSRQEKVTLPANNFDLLTLYTNQEVTDVSLFDGKQVGQVGTFTYMIHQFKVYVGDIKNDPTILCKGQSTLDASLSTIYLQIYNQVSFLWETIASDNTTKANHNFRLAYDILDFTNYQDFDNVISVRVYQLAI